MVLAAFDEITLLWVNLEEPSQSLPFSLIIDDLRLMINRVSYDRSWSLKNKQATYLDIRDTYLKALYSNDACRTRYLGFKCTLSTSNTEVSISNIQPIPRSSSGSSSSSSNTTTNAI
jgi:hypothetical protein